MKNIDYKMINPLVGIRNSVDLYAPKAYTEIKLTMLLRCTIVFNRLKYSLMESKFYRYE